MEKLGIEQTKEVLKTLELIGVTSGKVLRDGKVNMADLPHLIELMGRIDVVIKGVDGSKEIPSEIKDLDQSELIELGTMSVSIVKNIIASFQE